MRYVPVSLLSDRSQQWVPVRADDTQPNHDGNVTHLTAADLAAIHRSAAYDSGAVSNPPCPVSGWRSISCAGL